MTLIKLSLVLLLTYVVNGQQFNTTQISSTLDSLIEFNKVPGLNFSFITAEGKQYNYSSGYADKKMQKYLTGENVLFSGSIGKTYNVAVIMQLVDEGKLKLDDKFTDHVTDLDWLNRLPNIEQITVRMLLNHTSGLPRYIHNRELWKTLISNPDKIWSYKDRLEFIFDAPAVAPPGKKWFYSDTAYLLIGMLIEKLTGSNLYDEINTRLLAPGNLSETYPSITRELPNLPIGYSKLDPFYCMPDIMVEDGKYLFNPQMEWSGGGFASTTADLAKWAKYYYEAEFFSDSLLNVIVTPSLLGKDITNYLSCGTGSFIYKTDFGVTYGHTGFVPGFNAAFAYFPEYKIAAALQVNCDYAATKMKLIDYISDVLVKVYK